jgi:hypothetical protein
MKPEIIVKVPMEDRGAALDWIIDEYGRDKLFSIIWVEQDDDGKHVFSVTLLD